MSSLNEENIEYFLTITKDNIQSTDESFTLENLSLGDDYKPLDVKFEDKSGNSIVRKYIKGERRISNQTLPRLAFQIYENDIINLTDSERESFPICNYHNNDDVIYGIYKSTEEFKKEHFNSIERMHYWYGANCEKEFVIYCWNIFSTLAFVRECLKKFGKDGDKFILTYRKKIKTEIDEDTTNNIIDNNQLNISRNQYSRILMSSKNIILRGAPGTGKTYLAKEIATDIVSNGMFDKYESLTDEQKDQIGFVQFHPNYDYTDFVEGLRPNIDDDEMYFELKEGIFLEFVNKARANYENSLKSPDRIKIEEKAESKLEYFYELVENGNINFKLISGNEFTIEEINTNKGKIKVYNSNNEKIKKITLNINVLKGMLNSDKIFDKASDVTKNILHLKTSMAASYYLSIYNYIKSMNLDEKNVENIKNEKLNYVFIIDEINRGEISKILGELFFSIEPGYRGKRGEVSTQYANMHPDQKFYIPDNVYIIGTMNDIDRSVDTFDFAMRRRFRFIEIKAEDQAYILDDLADDLSEEAKKRMCALNKVIENTNGLNRNYDIGPAYFLKLKEMNFDELWSDCLEPLLRDYVQGMDKEEELIEAFKKAYNGVE